jgi:acetyl-CoA carboxylase carboxyl transferase subunit beta
MPLTEWFKNREKYTEITPTIKKGVPEGIWSRCASCNEIIYQVELVENLKVCPKCNFHFRLTASERINLLTDKDSFKEFDSDLVSTDPLDFAAAKTYKESLEQAIKETKLKEAVVTGEGKLDDRRIVLAVLDFGFIGGSMGSVVGERATRVIEKACSDKLPLIIVSSSGGARMQEGMFSLMQMAKTSAAIGELQKAKVPFISILTNPTTGGVLASFAMLGDVIIAEPGALIGFSGPRVIEQTIKQKLPKGFQSSEFLLEHGMVDMVVSRIELKEIVSKLLDFFT